MTPPAPRAPRERLLPRPARWGVLGACALVLALCATGEAGRLALRYDRAAIGAGEAWRLLTAHWVHLGWAHAGLNALGVLLCALLAPAVFDRWLPLRLLALSAGVGGLLWWAAPQVPDYVGLSGVLYGLFALGLLPQCRRDPFAAAALGLLLGWALWQWLAGPVASEERFIGGRIVTQAHLFGLLTGAGLAALTWMRRGRGPA